MMKTALSIVQSVCRRINHPVPTALAATTDPDELQVRELLYAVCEELRQARCWVQLKRKHSFNTANARALYPLPQDFYSPLLETHFNAAEKLRLIGPSSDERFADKIYGTDSSSRNFSYRIFGGDENPATTGGQIELSPTPTGVVNLKFEYLTRTFILPNTFVFPTAPQEAVAADTDLVVFDDDLVKLGLRAKILEDRGGDYEGPAAEFQSRIDKAVARYKGSYVGVFGGYEGGPRYRVQPRTWSL
jgi:hypothetical protein